MNRLIEMRPGEQNPPIFHCKINNERIMEKIVIIGGDAAGMTAASKIRRTDKKCEITVFEKGEHTSYAACGIPYFVAGYVDKKRHLIARTPEEFAEKQRIRVNIRHEAIKIDRERKEVEVIDLKTKKSLRIPYDKLLIATGASPVVPHVDGIKAKGVFTVSNLTDAQRIHHFIQKQKPKKAVVVGGGYIGLEMAEALLERDAAVSLIDMSPQVMNTMDEDMAGVIQKYMKKEGVKLYLNEGLKKIEKNEKGEAIAVVTDKHTLQADLVILGIGIKPNSGLAKDAGLKLGEKEAILVDKTMRTSDEFIWAAGDCATSYHLVKEKPVSIALGTVANKHGLIAGTNMSGADEEFPGVIGTAITKFKAMEIARTGLSEKEAAELNIPVKTTVITSKTKAGYYPGSEEITVKLVAEESSLRLLGGQIVGFAGSGKRIDTLAAAITAKLTARDLAFMDLSYAPPFSPVWDPVQIAARQLI